MRFKVDPCTRSRRERRRAAKPCTSASERGPRGKAAAPQRRCRTARRGGPGPAANSTAAGSP
eukprot:5307656-Lingulodinium_polyedra.AAC.1